jgi:hypothetical protein
VPNYYFLGRFFPVFADFWPNFQAFAPADPVQLTGRKIKKSEIKAGFQVLTAAAAEGKTGRQLSAAEKIEIISAKFRGIMEALGLDLTNDSLRDSPRFYFPFFIYYYYYYFGGV